MFVLLLIFAVGLLFWSIRQVAPGTKGSLIAGGFIIATLLCFLFRESTWAFAGQAFFAVWLCQALLLYLLWGIIRLVWWAVSGLKARAAGAEKSRAVRCHGFSEKTVRLVSRVLLGGSLLVAAIFLIVGTSANYNYKVREMEVSLGKSLKPAADSTAESVAEARNFTAVFFSDLHMDPLFDGAKLERLSAELDSIAPEFVLFGGDMADISTDELTRLGYDSLMKKLASSAKVAAVAIDGNHEGYMERSGSTPMAWLRSAGWHVLEDSTLCTSLACFSGRTDFQVSRFRDLPRSPLSNLAPSDSSLPWIIMDHQPKGIEPDYQGRLPDLGLSGHTHDGQFFPGTVIIDLVWRLSYGFGTLDGVKWLVTAGVDSWGPPVRVGSETEIWVLRFTRPE